MLFGGRSCLWHLPVTSYESYKTSFPVNPCMVIRETKTSFTLGTEEQNVTLSECSEPVHPEEPCLWFLTRAKTTETKMCEH